MKDPIFGEVIEAYTRKQAIEDGFQVACPEKLRIEAGAKFPVFFTRTLWDQYITPHPSLDSFGQSLNGRIWDVLSMWHFNVKAQRPEGTRMLFKVIFTMPYVRKPKAGENVMKHVGLRLTGNIYTSLSDDEIPNWDFSTHCEKEIHKIVKQ